MSLNPNFSHALLMMSPSFSFSRPAISITGSKTTMCIKETLQYLFTVCLFYLIRLQLYMLIYVCIHILNINKHTHISKPDFD